VDQLLAWARNGNATFHGLSLLQLCLLGALALGLGYWLLDAGLSSLRRLLLMATLVVAAVAVLRLALPDSFCTVHWPSPIAALC
jgi:hypothetical protein